jgi:hypothetical protein
MKSISGYFPDGSLQYFQLRHFGAGIGAYVKCDICGATPDEDLRFHRMKGRHYGYARWRWLLAHVRMEHVG